MKNYILNIFLFFLVFSASAGEIEIKGVYQGKNVFVQNPYNVEKKEFCTKEVYLNDVKILSAIRNSAFSINLSNLEIGSSVHIKIVYSEDCQPRIINPYVLQGAENYTFNAVAVADQIIKWSLNEPVLSGRFIIEKYSENYWKPVTTAAVVLNEKEYSVTLAPFIQNGTNKFRIKYLSPKEQVFISKNIEYYSAAQQISLNNDTSNRILLSKETSYEIIDADGNKIRDGKGKEIAISNLHPGTYYLNYENKSEKFLKK